MTDEAIHELATALSRLAESIDRLAETATEKGEKKIPPTPPYKKRAQKRAPSPAYALACAHACEGAAPVNAADALFDEFWSAYPSECPRKVRKAMCRAKYAKLVAGAEDPAALHAAILAGLARWRKCQDWVDNDGKFIMAPLVWLNQENWKDSPAPYVPHRRTAPLDRKTAEAERLNEAERVQKAKLRESAVAALTERDWALCAENCANCTGRSCAKGHRLTQRPVPPSDCPHFIAKGGVA